MRAAERSKALEPPARSPQTARLGCTSCRAKWRAGVLLLVAAAGSAAAADVQVLAAVTALDPAVGFVDGSAGGMAGPVQGTPPLSAAGITRGSGIVISSARVAADAYTGRINGQVVVSVGSQTPMSVGGGSATSSASMGGSITLAGAAPGMATFSGVVEGAYNFGNAPARFFNTGYVEANGAIGDSYSGLERQNFDPFSGAGLFSFPLTWTLAVQPGQTLQMQFYLRMQVTSQVGISEIDLLNTFKLTDITLPPGYTYTPDAQGFLSQFTPSAVPEPATSALMLAGVAVLAWRRRKTPTGW